MTHPTYRCQICRSLLEMGVPHSHRRTNRVVASYLNQPKQSPRYASGTGYMN